MTINFNFKSVADYLFSSSTKTDGASGAGTAQAGKSRSAFSFSAIRNSGWAKKCASFDPAKLARTISNDPRTKKAVETAKSGLAALYKQMTALLKNLRTDLNNGAYGLNTGAHGLNTGAYGLNTGAYGGYRPHPQQRLFDQWRAFLPAGAYLSGAATDPQTGVENVKWHMGGFQWDSTYDPASGHRTSATTWGQKDANGWEHSQWLDHKAGTPATHWFSAKNTATGQHTSQTAWSEADAAGWQRCKMKDHKTDTVWNSFHHAGTKKSYCRTDWSTPDKDGVKSRTHLDHNTGTRWHETLTQTGEFASKTDWHPDPTGAHMQRLVKNSENGAVHIELEDPNKPSGFADTHDTSVNMEGKSPADFAADMLGILGLGKDVTDKETIKMSYRKLSMKKHPDKAKAQGVSQEEATAAFKELNKAYKFLMSYEFPVEKKGE